ncbi:hypothetical protein RclHR1_10540002 [Rhizophagus clarus]|uniref:Uncharacterized protein n=1 Tax=Rhizophagus clarus TaxID=94130 RepID=A0A2Z6QUB4_9GLOM|nr:hypothetical protein RclHR1_10540002 [Rhizophagus clarus]
MDQTGNNTITTDPALQNNTFEFYLPLPNDICIYHITYTELNSIEIARLLNNRIDLSHIPNHQFPYHYNVQHLIRQQIIQQSVVSQQSTILQQSFDTIDNNQSIFQEYSDNSAYDTSSIQQPVDYQQDIIPSFDTTKFEFYLPLPNDICKQIQQSVGYQQVTIPQQSFDTIDIQPTFQECSDNAYRVSSIPFIQQPVDCQQDTIPQQSFDTFQEHSNNNAYNTTSIPSNSPEDNLEYNGV